MFKRLCVNCGENLKSGLLCEDCELKLIYTCRMRRRIIKLKGSKLELFYFWDYKSIARKIINNGKYRFSKQSFQYLIDIIVGHYVARIDFLRGTATYVPTTYLRYCYRGFNQAHLFAKEFVRKCIKVSEIAERKIEVKGLLRRTKYSKAQALLSMAARMSRHNPFRIKKNIKIPGRIILFDDVCTTGATLLMIQRELEKANPMCKVICVTLAYTPSWRKPTED